MAGDWRRCGFYSSGSAAPAFWSASIPTCV